MSKKKAITISVESKEELDKFMAPDYPKVVVCNAYQEFWGNCKCFETLIGKFQDMPANINRVDWICCNCDYLTDYIPSKMTFGSKPIYLIFVRGKFLSAVDGLNYPKLLVEIKKSYEEIDKEEL